MTSRIDTLCLHHNDADGICAGAIVRMFEENVTTHSINYGYEIPWKKIKEARKVYIVDFGFQPFSDMVKALEMKGDNLIWIDHHKTAIKDSEDSGRTFKGIQRVGIDGEHDEDDPVSKRAGCELTWEYFNPDTKYPDIVRMIGRYDVWDLKHSPDLFTLQAGLKYVDIDADNDQFWHPLFKDTKSLESLIDKGKTCLRYQDLMNTKYLNSHSYEMEWEGLRFLVCNAMNVNSQLFESKFDHNKHDAVMAWGYTNRNWTVSMYTDKLGVDVGAIARKYGGGGHTGACGFQCLGELPFGLQYKK